MCCSRACRVKRKSGIAIKVSGTPYDAAGHLPDMLLLAGHVAKIRSAR